MSQNVKSLEKTSIRKLFQYHFKHWKSSVGRYEEKFHPREVTGKDVIGR